MTVKTKNATEEQDNKLAEAEDMITSLQASMEELNKKIADLETENTDLQNQLSEQEKASMIGQLSNATDSERKFLNTLSTDKIKEYVDMKLEEEKQVKEDEEVESVATVETTPELSKEAPKLSETPKATVHSLSKEDVEKRIKNAWDRANKFNYLNQSSSKSN